MPKLKPRPGRVNDALLAYLRQGTPVVCARQVRTISRFADAERREREASERQRASHARAATRAYYERNADKVRAATRAWQRANPDKVRAAKRAYYRDHKDKWRTVYAENRKRAALRAAPAASGKAGAKATAAAADRPAAASRAKGVSLA